VSRDRNHNDRREPDDGLIDKVVNINRVSKVVKGGRRFSFSALVVVGDGEGRVGAALGKANEVPEAIRKGKEKARAAMFDVPMVGATIPHEIVGCAGAGRVLLKPASDGTGVIAGGAVRAIIEAAGVHNVLTKCIGTNNPNNVVHATIAALKGLDSPEAAAIRRGLPLEDVKSRHAGY
jgi:small subunit ribosomal protein S5